MAGQVTYLQSWFLGCCLAWDGALKMVRSKTAHPFLGFEKERPNRCGLFCVEMFDGCPKLIDAPLGNHKDTILF